MGVYSVRIRRRPEQSNKFGTCIAKGESEESPRDGEDGGSTVGVAVEWARGQDEFDDVTGRSSRAVEGIRIGGN